MTNASSKSGTPWRLEGVDADDWATLPGSAMECRSTEDWHGADHYDDEFRRDQWISRKRRACGLPSDLDLFE
jgi:hypothetical protein